MNRREFLKLCAASAALAATPTILKEVVEHTTIISDGTPYTPSDYKEWWAFWGPERKLVRFAGNPPPGSEVFTFPRQVVVHLPEDFYPDLLGPGPVTADSWSETMGPA